MSRRCALGLVAAGFAVVFVGVGCGAAGGSAKGSAKKAGLARGRELFQTVAMGRQEACGFCHTLRAAATTGIQGPDLDSEFITDRSTGITDRGIRKIVLDQIRNPQCFDPNNANRCMPKNLVSGADAAAVADFVTRCAGRAGTPGCRTVAGGLRGHARRGEGLYERLGCIGCHWSAGGVAPIAPSFIGLAGSKVELANGKTVTADDTYLLESILLPDHEIVKGYPAGFMSARIKTEHVTVSQAKAIIAYIKTLK